MLQHPLAEEHPYRLEECPPDVLVFWLLDVKLDHPLAFADFDRLSDAAVVARERAAIPVAPACSA